MYADLLIIYPKLCTIYLRGTIEFKGLGFGFRSSGVRMGLLNIGVAGILGIRLLLWKIYAPDVRGGYRR